MRRIRRSKYKWTLLLRPFDIQSANYYSDFVSGMGLVGSDFFSVSEPESDDFEVRLNEPDEER